MQYIRKKQKQQTARKVTVQLADNGETGQNRYSVGYADSWATKLQNANKEITRKVIPRVVQKKNRILFCAKALIRAEFPKKRCVSIAAKQCKFMSVIKAIDNRLIINFSKNNAKIIDSNGTVILEAQNGKICLYLKTRLIIASVHKYLIRICGTTDSNTLTLLVLTK